MLFATYTVTNTNDSGAGSLRQAMLDANRWSDVDTIKFSVGWGNQTIMPSSKLPWVVNPVIIDATSQPGYSGKPLIQINGSWAGAGADGIRVDAGGSTIKGLIINNFSGSGLFLYNKGYNTVQNCWIGLDQSGNWMAGNKGHGILVQSSYNTIGGWNTWDRNVISGNINAGIFLYGNLAQYNQISNNYIGTDASGSWSVGNSNGIHANGASNNRIGQQGRNVISGNKQDGVLCNSWGSTGNWIQNSYIGTNASGTGAVGNGMYGVEISQPNNLVGGVGGGAGNLVSGNNLSGVVLFTASATGNKIQCNKIGTDYSGTKALGNKTRGIEITNGATYNTVGGGTTRGLNIISGNAAGGIGIYSQSAFNWIQNNYIGLSVNPWVAIPNGWNTGVILTDNPGPNTIITTWGWKTLAGNAPIVPNDKIGGVLP